MLKNNLLFNEIKHLHCPSPPQLLTTKGQCNFRCTQIACNKGVGLFAFQYNIRNISKVKFQISFELHEENFLSHGLSFQVHTVAIMHSLGTEHLDAAGTAGAMLLSLRWPCSLFFLCQLSADMAQLQRLSDRHSSYIRGHNLLEDVETS